MSVFTRRFSLKEEKVLKVASVFDRDVFTQEKYYLKEKISEQAVVWTAAVCCE
jgi:hypothetical protein